MVFHNIVDICTITGSDHDELNVLVDELILWCTGWRDWRLDDVLASDCSSVDHFNQINEVLLHVESTNKLCVILGPVVV